MKKSDLVSVVIACYNDAEYIEQAVHSVRAQTYPNIELLVVDDGSNQKTKDKLEQLRQEIDKLLFQDNQGVCSARNKGILEANADYIFILDSDDYIAPNLLEVGMKLMKGNDEVKMVSCYAQQFNRSHKLEVLKPLGGMAKDFLITNRALGTSLYRKKDLVGIGGYDVKMSMGYEDWELNLNLLSKGGRAEIIKEPLYYYRIKESSRNKMAKTNKYQLQQHIYQKHKNIFIENFEEGLSRLFFKLTYEENRQRQLLNSPEYKLGSFLLAPFKFILKKGGK